MEELKELKIFVLVLSGLLIGIRAWLYYNLLLEVEGKKKIGIFKYINVDNNFVLNVWKIIPVNIKSLPINSKSFGRRINALTYFTYLIVLLLIYLYLFI